MFVYQYIYHQIAQPKDLLISAEKTAPLHQSQEASSASIRPPEPQGPIGNPDDLTIKIENIATVVFNSPSRGCFSYPNEQIKKKKLESYKRLEETFRKLREIKNMPVQYSDWDVYGNNAVTGGLRFSMTLQEVQSHVYEKFRELREAGILLYRSEFNQVEKPEKFRTVGVIYSSSQKSGELDRIWGAEYLRNRLKGSTCYRVPKFRLVIEDGLTTLPVRLWSGGATLEINSIDTAHGEVLVENIENGKPVPGKEHHELRAHGYTDLGHTGLHDDGNVLKGMDGYYYVVDTESKSFMARDKRFEKEPVKKLRIYAADRFIAFHMNNNSARGFIKTIEISLELLKSIPISPVLGVRRHKTE